jgi:hypothetical protein
VKKFLKIVKELEHPFRGNGNPLSSNRLKAWIPFFKGMTTVQNGTLQETNAKSRENLSFIPVKTGQVGQ